mmetsp:Transcript_52043/g.119746  ORF Transcript_52043/g.119746 Transcript_52043/m.119746 type:complete len:234 (+) Transcript_52043:205-906(+)
MRKTTTTSISPPTGLDLGSSVASESCAIPAPRSGTCSSTPSNCFHRCARSKSQTLCTAPLPPVFLATARCHPCLEHWPRQQCSNNSSSSLASCRWRRGRSQRSTSSNSRWPLPSRLLLSRACMSAVQDSCRSCCGRLPSAAAESLTSSTWRPQRLRKSCSIRRGISFLKTSRIWRGRSRLSSTTPPSSSSRSRRRRSSRGSRASSRVNLQCLHGHSRERGTPHRGSLTQLGSM